MYFEVYDVVIVGLVLCLLLFVCELFNCVFYFKFIWVDCVCFFIVCLKIIELNGMRVEFVIFVNNINIEFVVKLSYYFEK